MLNIFNAIKEKAHYLWRSDKDPRYVTCEKGCITYYPGKFSLFGYVVSKDQKEKMQFDEACFLIITAFIFLIDFIWGGADFFDYAFISVAFIYFIRYRTMLRTLSKNAVPYKLNRHHYVDMWLYGLLLAVASMPLIFTVVVFPLIMLPLFGPTSLRDFYFLLPDLAIVLILVAVPLWLFCHNLSVLLKMRKMEKAITP